MLLLPENKAVLLFSSNTDEVVFDGRIVRRNARPIKVNPASKPGDNQLQELQAGVP